MAKAKKALPHKHAQTPHVNERGAGDMAYILDLSKPRLFQLADLAIIPKPVQRGHYNLVEVCRGYINFLRGGKASGSAGAAAAANATPTEQLKFQQARLAAAKANAAELDNRLRAREVIPKAEVQAVWTEALSNLRRQLLAIPQKAAPLVATESEARVCFAILEDLINATLLELSTVDVVAGKRESTSGDDAGAGDEDSEAADETDGESVGGPESEA